MHYGNFSLVTFFVVHSSSHKVVRWLNWKMHYV